MFNKTFLVRMAEQMLIAFLLAAGAVLVASGDRPGMAALVGAAAAGARAVYGVFATAVNDPEQPHVAK